MNGEAFILNLLSELGVPAAVALVGFYLYFLENRKRPSEKEKPQMHNSETEARERLWLIENIRDPIIGSIKDLER